MKKFVIINGPNLNLLGQREPEIYGRQSFEDFFGKLQEEFKPVELSFFQSNIEGEIIGKIQFYSNIVQGIVLNPGGYAHTSVAIRDAIAASQCPVIEVHISNIYNREEFRKHCITAGVCVGVISGLGLNGYKLALNYLQQF